MKGRNSQNQYPDGIQAKVEQGSRENSEIVLAAHEMEALGHHRRNPMKVIRAMCLDCMADQPAQVRKCTSVGCPLWPYRLGKNPFRTPSPATGKPFGSTRLDE